MHPKIIFTLSATGDLSIDVENAIGSNCVELTKPFEDLLGSSIHSSQKVFKDSFYITEEIQENKIYE